MPNGMFMSGTEPNVQSEDRIAPYLKGCIRYSISCITVYFGSVSNGLNYRAGAQA